MGFYIEAPSNKGKAKYLIETYHAEEVEEPTRFIPSNDIALLCVVHNKDFEACAYIYDEKELLGFIQKEDLRKKDWLVMDKKKVEELSGYAKVKKEEEELKGYRKII